MLFKKNKVKIGRKYNINNINYLALYYDSQKEILLVKDSYGNLEFILDDFIVQKNNIICTTKIGYTVSCEEIHRAISEYISTHPRIIGLRETLVDVIREQYHQIPRLLAEVIIDWYIK